jgi:hypothetical protein
MQNPIEQAEQGTTGTMYMDRIATGVRNLLTNCAELQAGQRLLILREPAGLGYYGDTLADDVAAGAQALGLVTQIAEVPFLQSVSDPDAATATLMKNADCTLFLARMGDQIRFRSALRDVSAVVCYALDSDMLASPFGTVNHRSFLALKQMIDAAVAAASEIRVTCPLGTDFRGRQDDTTALADVNVRRFPMSVYTPTPAAGFSGRIAQLGFLVGTGSSYYDPYACRLEETLFVDFSGNRITGFSGFDADIATARAHYARVAAEFSIDDGFVHSWHVGIHPGCAFPNPASASFERWTGGAFGNPRLLHFHTCGAYAPGEISLNVLDPTVYLDGVAVWENGRLYPERVAGGRELLNNDPEMQRCFDAPARQCGLGADGALSFV